MDKLTKLRQIIADMGSCLVAFSGGVDSTLLLKVAAETLGDQAAAVTAVSAIYPRQEQAEAQVLARQLGARQILIEFDHLSIPGFAGNSPQRCYICKYALFSRLVAVAREQGFMYVCDGTNADDCRDFRPGMKAVAELGVRSPLMEAGLTKEEIREISAGMGLPTWNKPTMACLASRFPYGEEITGEKIKRVGAAEDLLRSLGLQQLRVRHHQEIARIEVLPEAFPLLLSRRAEIVAGLKQLGFTYVTMDLQGYRSGSLNVNLEGAGNK